MAVDDWGADVPVSIPEPNEREIKVGFSGMGFTTGGITHDITEAEREDLLMPSFAPPAVTDGF